MSGAGDPGAGLLVQLVPVLVTGGFAAILFAVGAALLAAVGGGPLAGLGTRRAGGAGLAAERSWTAAAEASVLALVAGLVALHVLLLGYDLAGVPWRRRTLAAGLLALAAGGLLAARARRRRSPAAPAPPVFAPDRVGWGDGLALAALVPFAVACWSLRITIPDFVYHWGLKGERYFLARGVDWAYLADPLRLTDHPDYPNLLPGLYAATAHLRGFFDERAMLLWTVVWLAALVLAARRALAAAGGRAVRQAALAATAGALAMFGIGYDMAGGADWLVALAVVLALPALLGAAESAPALWAAGDLEVGLAAALAAAAKIEGIPLALFLVAVRAVAVGPGTRWRSGLRALPGRLPRLAGPAALVILPWWLENLRHGLFQAANTGTWDAARPSLIASALPHALAIPQWHGLAWLLLLLLPLPAAVRRTRAAGALLALQTGFYLFVYLTSPVDTFFYVLSSFPRLLFHLVPGVLICAAVLLSPRRRTAGPVSAPLRPAAGPPTAAAAGGRRSGAERAALALLLLVTAVVAVRGWRFAAGERLSAHEERVWYGWAVRHPRLGERMAAAAGEVGGRGAGGSLHLIVPRQADLRWVEVRALYAFPRHLPIVIHRRGERFSAGPGEPVVDLTGERGPWTVRPRQRAAEGALRASRPPP